MQQQLDCHRPGWSQTIALLALWLMLGLTGITRAAPPADSATFPREADARLLLLNPLDQPAAVHAGGYQVDQPVCVAADPALGVKFGQAALTLRVTAKTAGSKGHFSPQEKITTPLNHVGCWVHLPPDANVQKVGFQIYDRGGEAFIFLTPADWTGWKWIETPLTTDALKHAYTQKDADGQLDQPVNAVQPVWFVKQPGPSELTIDGLFGKSIGAAPADQALSIELSTPTDVQRDGRFAGAFFITNASAEPAQLEITVELQRDGRMYDAPLPDPVLGLDHATAAISWTLVNGEKIAENTLTDGIDWTTAETRWGGKWTESFQYVQLDRPRRITALGWLSGDANWVWEVDVAASTDGENFTPVPQWQNVNLHKRWGAQMFPEVTPFDAKVLRLRYHHQGETVNVIRMPSALRIYDGPADESFAIPSVGEKVAQTALQLTVPPRAVQAQTFQFDPPLNTGAYLLTVQTRQGGQTRLEQQSVFVEPAPYTHAGFDARFGLNASNVALASEHVKLGIGWIRFENFKWPMVSPAPHQYAYDGSVRPWSVNVDHILQTYHDAGLQVIPMMFLTPQWASGADDKVDQRIRLSLPPRDNADFGEFAFQSVARYGSKEIPSEQLKTPDQRSGLNLVKVFELGNEPNLNPRKGDKLPGWGAWAGTMDQWWETFRAGVAGIRAADPDAIVSSPGFAGCTVEVVDALRAYTYADGSHPLDLVDLINVHYYSGRTPPERATRDANTAGEMDVTFEEHLERLCEWRDRHKPGVPIWMTETGYDTGGPIGTNERLQAARLPRVVMLCLVGGLDKVIVYRETGSTPTQHAAAGVLRNDLTRKPSWYTYANLIRMLDGATPGEKLTLPDDNIRLQTWTKAGRTMLVAYAITGSATLNLDLGSATITDAFGQVSHVTTTRGLALSEFPQYLTELSNEAALAPLITAAAKAKQQRRAARAADAQRTYHLFNFGQPGEPIGAYLGQMRYYAAADVEMLYGHERGYGFIDLKKVRNNTQHWKPRPLERTSVSLGAGTAFRFDLQPGTYELSLGAEARDGSATITVEGAAQPVSMPISTASQGAVITVQEKALTIRVSADTTLYWLMAASK